MKALMTVAMAGILSYNTMGAYGTLVDTVSGIQDVYESAYEINFFAPIEIREMYEKVFFDKADRSLGDIASAAHAVADNPGMEPQQIIYQFSDTIVIN